MTSTPTKTQVLNWDLGALGSMREVEILATFGGFADRIESQQRDLTQTWRGVSANAATDRAREDAAIARTVVDELRAVTTAMANAVGQLEPLRQRVYGLVFLAGAKGFTVADNGEVSAADVIASLKKAGAAEGSEPLLTAEREATELTADLGQALIDAGNAAAAAQVEIDGAVARMEEAVGLLGEPPAVDAEPATTTPAAAGSPVSDSSTSTLYGPNQGGSSGGGDGGSYAGSSTGGGGLGSSGGPPTGPMPSGEVGDWIREALAILEAEGVDTSNIDPRDLAAMIQHESGGDPRAINLYDSNAAAGIPSKGVMQTIDSTFNAYKLAGHDDIWNPVDNIIAGVRYSLDRYGSVDNVPGIQGLRSGSGYVGY